MFLFSKNILELYIYDDDRFTRDDCCSTILFDISNLTLGQNLKKCFISDDKVNSYMSEQYRN